MSGSCTMLVGKPTGSYKHSTIIVVLRKPRSKWWTIVCFGQKGHYRKDGSCVHTDEVLECLNPACVCLEYVRVVGWGKSKEAKA